MGFPSIEFYQSKLTAHHSVANHVLFQNEEPLLFIDTAGCGFDEKAEGTSSSNPDEAAFLLKHLSTIAAELAIKLSPAEFPSFGIIAPYKQQIQILNELLPTYPHLQQFLSKITVNTVDGFQGQERDVIYISLTRSNAAGIIGFLADIRRMNVAITRARKKLVVIGDSATLSRLKFYADFIAYAEKHNAYKSAWEFMDV
jgi:superfamily I DNA and/or RNA helicase